MRTRETQVRAFQKVGECLYRYSSNGVYYARFTTHGKQILRSLRTTDPDIARRNLAQRKAEQGGIDRSRGTCTLAELADEYLRTAQHEKPATIERKTLIVRRIKSDCRLGRSRKSRKSNRRMCGAGLRATLRQQRRIICIWQRSKKFSFARTTTG